MSHFVSGTQSTQGVERKGKRGEQDTALKKEEEEKLTEEDKDHKDNKQTLDLEIVNHSIPLNLNTLSSSQDEECTAFYSGTTTLAY